MRREADPILVRSRLALTLSLTGFYMHIHARALHSDEALWFSLFLFAFFFL